MDKNNPYQTPGANVYDVTSEGFDESSPFSSSGRFGRLSYLAWTTLLNLSLGLIMSIVIGGFAAMQQQMLAGGKLMLAFQLVTIMVLIFFSIRRFHDMNASGWWALLLIVPIVNFVTALVLLFKAGNVGANDYGLPRRTRGWEKVVGYIFIGMMVLGLIGIVAAIIIPLVAS
ncbi:MAG: DUF805 domain-containing protein [Gammaproteobacteria bacterium]|jgi:uncharacterized membrane protein YhaH (DUF805 family)